MRLLPSVIVVAVLLGASGCSPDGAALFEREGCLVCHRFKGEGGFMGPDLTAVTARLSDRQIIAQIRGEAGGEGRTRMPAYGYLSSREVKALLHHLKQ